MQVRPRCNSNPRVQGVSHGVSVQRTGSCCCRDSDAWGRRVTSDTDKQTPPPSALPTSSTPEWAVAEMYTVSEKCHYFVSLYVWRTWIEFDNFWHKCYWESRQSTATSFSTSPNYCFCTACTSALAVPLHCQTSTSRWLNLFSLVTCNSCLCLLCDSLNLIVSELQLWSVMGS